MDITLYRDDLMRHAVGPQRSCAASEILFSIDEWKKCRCWLDDSCCTRVGRLARPYVA
jgi:hypothetical protein